MRIVVVVLCLLLNAVGAPVSTVLVPYQANGISVDNLDQAITLRYTGGEVYVFHFAFDPPDTLVICHAWTNGGDHLVCLELSSSGVYRIDI